MMIYQMTTSSSRKMKSTFQKWIRVIWFANSILHAFFYCAALACIPFSYTQPTFLQMGSRFSTCFTPYSIISLRQNQLEPLRTSIGGLSGNIYL
ncbi:hypothetical protein SERLA73DRAFT_179551 [Serpula lacrymans var. lacrymans S7.3]|uniref:Uncharacterized protein n=1 Tax=Serpula lacrymans var. lacrymans (strain S7.3) TaxID=936435 RepID=F8PT08_SERL3|nr:hypothetical protein SERLA73DRAFT_179551 [Serpula lacrymans var. lacrymans S7.3]